MSQILTCLLNAVYLARTRGIHYFLMNHFVWPMIFSSCLFYLAKLAGNWLAGRSGKATFGFAFLIPAAILIFIYLYYFRLVRWKDFAGKK